MATKINQKEYLKKYLGGIDEEKKKKKKSFKFGVKKVKIIDDDIDLNNIRPVEDGEFSIVNNSEDAPQIVGVIDERRHTDFSDRKKWRVIADDGEGNIAITSFGNNNNSTSQDKEPCINEEFIMKRTKSESEKIFERRKYHDENSSKNRESDSDLSPPRTSDKTKKSKNFNSNSKSSHKFTRSRGSDSDLSPPRTSNRMKQSKNFDSNSKSSHKSSRKSPERMKDYYATSESNSSYYRKSQKESIRRTKRRRSKSRSPENQRHLKTTLDGKTAGLQSAQDLREETIAYKKKEADLFRQMDIETSGVGQAAVLRDKKTGKRRNLEAEATERKEKLKRQKEIDEKYARWGKGLKQVDDHMEKLKDDLYEMSKPLARYADDADLDARLRAVEREGDPMLKYLKEKQIKEGKRKPDEPTYQGAFMPNRFGIKPGHRWDGVDRSNGYEKRWFEAQNAKTAVQEEAYKWSTSDM